jgi:hypothetical protein
MQALSSNNTESIIVKFAARMPLETARQRFMRHFPGNIPVWGRCRFVFDIDCKEYDWFVVYHDLYRQKNAPTIEQLQCPREKTILITTEPSTITVYGTDYLRQFGTVVTSQEPWAISHPNSVFHQPGLMWYYGCNLDTGAIRSYDEIKAAVIPEKSRLISTVCSSRKGRLTLHRKRYDFIQLLQERIPELDRFGHGVNPIADKAEMLDSYKYHITVENHVYPHHITEKLPDAFLGFTLPFYHGCNNAKEYFPADSFIHIDIDQLEKTVDIIQSTIANNEYKDRLPYIIEARNRVLEDNNLFAVLERQILNQEARISTFSKGKKIMNRQTIRIRKPLAGIRSVLEKFITKGRHVL